jgi:aspartate aminotransferase
MPQPGYPEVRQSIASFLSSEQGVMIKSNNILMTCGAAGALNVIFKALLDPKDEIIVPKPYFIDYKFYIENHGGLIRMVPTQKDFTLDLDAIANAITKNTKAVLINSPNNPTGQIYSAECLQALGNLLSEKSSAFGKTIYLISDEPYRHIVFNGQVVPSIFRAYKQSIIASSYSKVLSIPGERIGFAAVHPDARHSAKIMAAMVLAIRILGFVNAPALMQRVIADIQGATVDISLYARKRELMCAGLADVGYEFIKPPGAFYLFPRSPIEDDVKFVHELQKELILVVPGSGFACPGHFRIAFCVEDETISNALSGFKRVMERYR